MRKFRITTTHENGYLFREGMVGVDFIGATQKTEGLHTYRELRFERHDEESTVDLWADERYLEEVL